VNPVLLIALAVALLALVALQIIGQLALRGWGVEPSRGVLVLRAANVAIAVGVVLFAIWKLAG
jgi:hypothetical protein